MNLTEIKVCPVNQTSLRAYVSITIDGNWTIKDIKIVKGPYGLIVAMPSKKMKNGFFTDVVHPINAPTRNLMEKLILEAYFKEV